MISGGFRLQAEGQRRLLDFHLKVEAHAQLISPAPNPGEGR
jgi:hypothetical protein